MKRLFTLLILALTFSVGSYAQNEVHIVQETGTTVVNLDDVSSIDLTDEPWSEWEETSGTFNFSLYVSGAYDISVLYREHLIDATKAQFLLGFTAIGAKEDVLVDVNTETGACQVGVHYFLDSSKYGPVYVSDMPHYPLQPGLTYDKYPCTFNAERGLFSFNLIYFVSTDLGSGASGSFANGVETLQLDGFYVPDYSFDISYQGAHIDDNGNEYAVVQAVKGVDISKYQITVATADSDLDAIVAGMKDGSVDCQTMTESAEIKFPIHQSDEYAILAVTYDENEQPVSEYSRPFEFWLGGDNPWESLGYAVYTDDLVLPLFSNPAMSYYVEVLENKEQPGMFRLVDLYGSEHPLYPYSTYEEGSYIEIDATDPDGVWFEGIQSTGMDVSGNGLMSLMSLGWYAVQTTEGATKEDAKEDGLLGVYADGVITFPANAVAVVIGNKMYYGHVTTGFHLDMTNLLDSIPEGAAAARAPKAKLGRIEAIEAFEMPVKRSAGKKSNELIGVEPKVNVTLKPVPSVKFKKADASQNGLVER